MSREDMLRDIATPANNGGEVLSSKISPMKPTPLNRTPGANGGDQLPNMGMVANESFSRTEGEEVVPSRKPQDNNQHRAGNSIMPLQDGAASPTIPLNMSSQNPVESNQKKESASDKTKLLIDAPSIEASSSSEPTFRTILLRTLLASLPSIIFAGLGVDNATGKLYGEDLGEIGLWVERLTFPPACFIVNFATASEEQENIAKIIWQLFWQSNEAKEFRKKWSTKEKNIRRSAFIASAGVACVAALATIQMAMDGVAKFGMTSDVAWKNLFCKIIAITCLSVLYTIVTRTVGSYDMLVTEIPKFLTWLNRKYHMLLNDPQHEYFMIDVQMHINSMISQAHLQVIKKFLNENTMTQKTAQGISEFLMNDLGYSLFPTKKKLALTTGMVAGSYFMGSLLYSLALSGAGTLNISGESKVGVAYAAMGMTEIFYWRVCFKFYDRLLNGFDLIKEGYFHNLNTVAFLIFFALAALVISVATSAGFVFESDKANANNPEYQKRIMEMVWTVYSGLLANYGYTLLRATKAATIRLDAKTIKEHSVEISKPEAETYRKLLLALVSNQAAGVNRAIKNKIPSGISRFCSWCSCWQSPPSTDRGDEPTNIQVVTGNDIPYQPIK